MMLQRARTSRSSPTTSTAAPVSAATEQEHEHNDDEDQFHGNSPLMAMALFAVHQAFNGALKVSFPTTMQPATCIAKL
jgi:hypothetical protein